MCCLPRPGLVSLPSPTFPIFSFRIDFIESDFKDAILASAEEQISAIEALRGEFLRHSERLIIARMEKWEAEKRREEEEDAGLYGEDRGRRGKDDDLYSDASSVSGISDATSKSTRSNASSSFTRISDRNANRAVKRKEKKMRSLKVRFRSREIITLTSVFGKAGVRHGLLSKRNFCPRRN